MQLQLTTPRSAWGATGDVETVGVMPEPSILEQYFDLPRVDHVAPRPSTGASEDELGAHAAAG